MFYIAMQTKAVCFVRPCKIKVNIELLYGVLFVAVLSFFSKLAVYKLKLNYSYCQICDNWWMLQKYSPVQNAFLSSDCFSK